MHVGDMYRDGRAAAAAADLMKSAVQNRVPSPEASSGVPSSPTPCTQPNERVVTSCYKLLHVAVGGTCTCRQGCYIQFATDSTTKRKGKENMKHETQYTIVQVHVPL